MTARPSLAYTAGTLGVTLSEHDEVLVNKTCQAIIGLHRALDRRAGAQSRQERLPSFCLLQQP